MGVLTLPAGSVAVTVAVCGPSLSGSVGVQLQLPLLSATVVHSVVGLSVTFTVLPGSAVPLKVGVLSLVLPLATGAVTTGTVGGMLSTVKGTGGVVVLLPLGSVIVATTFFGPLGNGVVDVQLQLPLLSTVVVHSTVPVGWSVTVTAAPGVPVPAKVGVVVVIG